MEIGIWEVCRFLSRNRKKTSMSIGQVTIACSTICNFRTKVTYSKEIDSFCRTCYLFF